METSSHQVNTMVIEDPLMDAKISGQKWEEGLGGETRAASAEAVG